MIKKFIIGGCLIGASFFIGCNQQTPAETSETETDSTSESGELDMYESSELAELMRKMYEDNVEIGKGIEKGIIPETFPEDFYTIHSAEATPGMLHDTIFFNNMAKMYLANLKKITAAETSQEAKVAYNEMVMTCAGCHQVYCQGPLPKIRKMKLSLDEETAGQD